MRKKILVIGTTVVMVAVLVPGSAASSVGETTRTPPYDLGCLYVVTCVPSDEARNGTLRGGKIPMASVTYSIPPFPVITTWQFSGEAGIYVDVPEHSFIRFSATVRRATPADPTAVDVKACFALTPPGFGDKFRGISCTAVPADGQPTEVTTDFDGSIWGRDGFEPGRYSFWVHLRGDHTFSGFGSFGEVQVDSMSYSMESMESGDTTPPTNPALSSPSHTLSTWSSDRTVDVSFIGASDPESGVDGFSYEWSTSPTTIPDEIKDAEESASTTTSPALADGNSHYFHLRTRDNAGNWSAPVSLGPFYIDENPPITAEATGYKEKGLQKVDLSWTGGSAATFDVYRNATLIATVENDGSYRDNIDQRGSGTYTYRLCEAATSNCSNEATVHF